MGQKYTLIDQACGQRDLSVMPTSTDDSGSEILNEASRLSIYECSKLKDGKVARQESYKKEMVLSQSAIIINALNQPKLSSSNQLDARKVDSKLESRSKFSAVTLPRYLSLEPSLAMDWLEISWDELHIKERVGAGNFFLFLIGCML